MLHMHDCFSSVLYTLNTINFPFLLLHACVGTCMNIMTPTRRDNTCATHLAFAEKCNYCHVNHCYSQQKVLLRYIVMIMLLYSTEIVIVNLQAPWFSILDSRV